MPFLPEQPESPHEENTQPKSKVSLHGIGAGVCAWIGLSAFLDGEQKMLPVAMFSGFAAVVLFARSQDQPVVSSGRIDNFVLQERILETNQNYLIDYRTARLTELGYKPRLTEEDLDRFEQAHLDVLRNRTDETE
jgi:hypothetical protein